MEHITLFVLLKSKKKKTMHESMGEIREKKSGHYMVVSTK
jgi:hypothetical protein